MAAVKAATKRSRSSRVGPFGTTGCGSRAATGATGAAVGAASCATPPQKLHCRKLAPGVGVGSAALQCGHLSAVTMGCAHDSTHGAPVS